MAYIALSGSLFLKQINEKTKKKRKIDARERIWPSKTFADEMSVRDARL